MDRFLTVLPTGERRVIPMSFILFKGDTLPVLEMRLETASGPYSLTGATAVLRGMGPNEVAWELPLEVNADFGTVSHAFTAEESGALAVGTHSVRVIVTTAVDNEPDVVVTFPDSEAGAELIVRENPTVTP